MVCSDQKKYGTEGKQKGLPHAGGLCIQNLRCRWIDAYSLLRLAEAFEFHNSRDQCEESVVAPDAYIAAGVHLRTPLTDQDAAGRNKLSAEALHSQPLGIAIATVARTSTTFFMSHTRSPA